VLRIPSIVITQVVTPAVTLAAGLTLLLVRPTRAEAQYVAPPEYRFEISPFAGYQWGGSFDTDALAPVPAGQLQIGGDLGWGVILSFLAQMGTAVELTYLRQDTDLDFDPSGAAGKVGLGGFATNYIHLGGRQEFGSHRALRPFLDASVGLTVFDPKAEEVGSSTKFSFAFGGGAKYMFGASQRAGLRLDGRVWITPVPSGDYAVWCDFFGCFSSEGTAWVTQGQVSGGLVFAF
jgi:hypothetical protein